MRHRRYLITLTPFVTRISILFIVGVFALGGLLGFTIGSFVGIWREPNKEAVLTEKVAPLLEPLESILIESNVDEPIESVEEEASVLYYDCPLDTDLQDYIRALCEEKQVPMELVIALIEVESSFQANAVSKTNDYGLMQINRINHEWLTKTYGITDFTDPYQNVLCGITILSQHYHRFGDTDKALMAYNLGATGAKHKWEQGVYETSYTQKIKSAMEVYENEI